MCVQPGDTLFVGRYLVNGADQSSLYLEVKAAAGHWPASCLFCWLGECLEQCFIINPGEQLQRQPAHLRYAHQWDAMCFPGSVS